MTAPDPRRFLYRDPDRARRLAAAHLAAHSLISLAWAKPVVSPDTLMGMEATGNARRESFAHAPMRRMTNTFMLGGKDDPDELVSRAGVGQPTLLIDGLTVGGTAA